jgi:adenosylcobyric acid synthase
MLQGTGSDVGKSLLVAGLCRHFARAGLTVRPFKPQNMSNNAAATADGGEIGRAQALQARACRVAPSVHMNPVLLKPESERGAQVIVQGRRHATAAAADYQAMKPRLMPAVLDSFARLSAEADLVIVEGAGSPAEVNLRAGDIANMGFARAANVPVVLVGDIDRGGVIASLVGTRAVIDEADAAMIRGFLVNRFRGDPRLFEDGLAIVARRTGWPSLGLVPWFAEAHRLPAEDAVALSSASPAKAGACLRVAVPMLPRIANFDDLDPLKQEPAVDVVFVPRGEALPGDAALVVLPGSKATIADLSVLRAEGWDVDLSAHVRRGGRVLGLCGGYQMLGRTIADPDGIEGPPGTVEGLGLLAVDTVLTASKATRPATGVEMASGLPVTGYEIHLGRTEGPDCARPFAMLAGRPDGATSPDGRVAGSYLHGVFAGDAVRADFLARLGVPSALGYEAGIEATLDALADHLASHVDMDRLLSIARERQSVIANASPAIVP